MADALLPYLQQQRPSAVQVRRHTDLRCRDDTEEYARRTANRDMVDMLDAQRTRTQARRGVAAAEEAERMAELQARHITALVTHACISRCMQTICMHPDATCR